MRLNTACGPSVYDTMDSDSTAPRLDDVSELSAQGIEYGFGRGRECLRSIDLKIAPGDVIGLGGVSGVGKSTLGRLLAGHFKPDAGEVLMGGQALHAWPKTQPSPVQYVPQSAELAIDPRWTIERVLHNGGEPESELLSLLGIQRDWFSRYPHELSGGELARVSLARLLLPTTRFLICDEITEQLDALSEQALWQGLMAWAKARNIGILLISHQAALRHHLCQRDYRLTDGVLIECSIP